MDLGSIIVGLFIVGICALPFILMNRGAKGKAKQLVRSLSDFAERKNGHIDEQETGRDFAIGLDRVGQAVFFYKEWHGEETRQMVRLADVDRCELKVVSRTSAPDKGQRKVIEQIQLVFRPVEEHDQETVTLVLYNVAEHLQLGSEMVLAERWKQKLQALLMKTVG